MYFWDFLNIFWSAEWNMINSTWLLILLDLFYTWSSKDHTEIRNIYNSKLTWYYTNSEWCNIFWIRSLPFRFYLIFLLQFDGSRSRQLVFFSFIFLYEIVFGVRTIVICICLCLTIYDEWPLTTLYSIYSKIFQTIRLTSDIFSERNWAQRG